MNGTSHDEQHLPMLSHAFSARPTRRNSPGFTCLGFDSQAILAL